MSVLRRIFLFVLASNVAMTLLPCTANSQLAKGKSKFLGSSMSNIRTDFPQYFNQVTPENAGKWGSVEGAQGSYNWAPLDVIYNFATGHAFRYRHHNLVWGAQQPGWITSVDSATQRAEVEKWIDSVAIKYGATSYVDVVNEPLHSPPPYRHALGDSGVTGWDWVVTAFTLARQDFFPTVKLFVNDYNILQDNAVTDRYLRLIDTLKVRHLIDGIGIQGHYFEFKSPQGSTPSYSYSIGTLKYNLDRLTATGLPVQITEFDINEANDSVQLANYKTYFPLFWEEPGVTGITLWGYAQGTTWQPNAYLVRTDGSERPALQWLRRYLASPDKPLLISPLSTTGAPRNPQLVWHSSSTALSYRVQVSTANDFTPAVIDTSVTDTLARVSPLTSNTQYYWRVSAANDSGSSSFSAAGTFTTGDLIESVKEPEGRPFTFELAQNYPNPFNPSTTIQYTVAGTRGQGLGVSEVRIVIYDVLGRDVATLVNGRQSPGTHTVQWNAQGNASGVYFYRLTVGSFSAVRKLVLMR